MFFLEKTPLCDVWKEKEDAKAAMGSLEAKGKETQELEELYNDLERRWNAYKQSKSRTWPRCWPDSGITVKAIQLLQHSPRHLMSQLQDSNTVIAGDGRKLKGRRLFQAMDGEDGMGQVTRSLSFCYSSSSSSSSPFASGEEEANLKGAEDSVCVTRDVDRKNKINGGRYIVMLGGFGIALLIFLVCMRSATSYCGFEGILVPT